jgi:hypothetical protein
MLHGEPHIVVCAQWHGSQPHHRDGATGSLVVGSDRAGRGEEKLGLELARFLVSR